MPPPAKRPAIRAALGSSRHAAKAAALLLAAVVLAAMVLAAAPAPAYDVVGYSPAANNRFASGFPGAPVTNTSGSFVGLAYSWLGAGWASGDPTKGFGFLTPKHYLVARHYGGWPTINLLAANGQVVTGTQATVTDTGYGFVQSGQTVGDISIGELTVPLPAAYGLPRYGVFDVNATSTSNSSANGQSLLVYGRGPDGTQSPRIGPAAVNGTTVSGSNSYVTSNVSTGTFQYGDSGSPTFIPWTNPNGSAELTIIGNNAATDFATINVYNYLGAPAVLAAVNALTTPDGYAVKVVGTPSNTWVGSSSTSIGNRDAWGLSPPSSAPSDKYVLFNGTSAGNGRAVAVDANANLRGLFFKSTGSGTLGFTFSGTGTLTVGRGGLTNYDASRQTLTAAVTLAAPQYWNVGAGGVTAAAVNTGTAGFLLEVDGSGTAHFTGTISGSGGIALSGRRLELTGSNSFTGGTWVHAGTLSIGNAAALRLSRTTVERSGTLAVSGWLQPTVAGLDLSAGGLVDVAHGGMTVASGLSTSTLLAALMSGRNDGSWNGTSGITSAAVAAAVAAGEERAVGWLDNGDGSLFFAYAAPGDTNLDGLVDSLDNANFLAGGKLDTGLPATWIEGDFTYDGIVDVLDAASFASTGLFDAGFYNVTPGQVAMAAVPEPVMPAACGLAILAFVANRGRRRCRRPQG
ncbi:MAG: autotransporter-associated beta strand repeat-containing protein [Planctomycetaceae bacterium]